MIKEQKIKQEFSDSISCAKEFLVKEKVSQEKCLNEIFNSFNTCNIHSFFERKKTTLDIKESNSLNGQFTYYKLDLEYLKSLDIILIPITSESYFSYDSNCINFIYVEYYFCTKTSSVILVEYHFKHVKLLSKNAVLNTFVFVNYTSDIYYYNGFLGKQLLNHFKANMNISDSMEILAHKKFNVVPSNDRIYRINSLEHAELFEPKKLEDISLIPKNLFAILLNKYENANIPAKSELKVETNFIGFTNTFNTVISTVPINDKYSGTIETYEKLLMYEIVLYFSNTPDKKVKARFFLTEAEKNKTLILTNEYLEDAILEDVQEYVFKEVICKTVYNVYNSYIINQRFSDTKELDFTLKNDIRKIICENSTIENYSYEYSLLKDTFKKIYINFFKIHIENFPKKYCFNQIRENKLEYDDNGLVQTSMYSIVCQNSIYLLKFTCYYKAYTYEENNFFFFLPVFSISDIEIDIFKPFSTSQVDNFIYDNLDSSDYLLSFNISSLMYNNFTISSILTNGMFPNFDIGLERNKNCFKYIKVCNDTIYNKILDCIQTPKVLTSTFNFGKHYPFMYDDENDTISKIPISSNGLIYAYYLYDGNNTQTINCSFTDDTKQNNYYSTVDDLLSLTYEIDIPFYKVTFSNLYPFSSKIEYNLCLDECPLWKECINFLLNIVV